MNIPGYTAEATLYRTSAHYRMRESPTRANGAIQPAFWYCFPYCVPTKWGHLCAKLCYWFPDPVIIDPSKVPLPDPQTSVLGLSTGEMAFG
jgi:hypothetical protein